MFETIPSTPADPLYEVAARYQADPRPERIDLGVGVYRDADGHSPVMRSVKAAEQRLVERQTTKAYGPLTGNPDFLALMQDLVLGKDCTALREKRVVAVQTCGGTGALRLAAALTRMASDQPRIHIGTPTWPSHAGVFGSEAVEPVFHRYWLPGAQEPCLDDISATARKTQKGEIFLFHGPCHNPTGIDLTLAERRDLLATLDARGSIPLIDIAYYGLGDGLEKDLDIVRDAFHRSGRAMAAISCSKSFGLYRERTGILLVQCTDSSEAARVRDLLGALNRMLVSSPPAHGAEVVATILGDPALTAAWRCEIEEMRMRITALRHALADSGLATLRPLRDQRGIFAMLPLDEAQIRRLGQDHAVHLPKNGRINIVGLTKGDVHTFSCFLEKIGLE